MKKLWLETAILLLLIPGVAPSQITVPANNGDLGAQINAAAAALPANGGKIKVQTQSNGQCYSYSVPIVITTPIILEGQGPSTCLSFAGTGTAVTFFGNPPSFVPAGTFVDGFGLRDLSIIGAGPGSGQTGLAVGGTGNLVGFYGLGLTISNFGLGLQFNRGVWNFKIEHSMFAGNAQSVLWPSDLAFGGENLEFDSVTFAGASSGFVNSLHFDADIGGGYSNMNSLTFVSCNFDNAQLVIDNGSGSVRLYSPHFENAGGLSGNEPFVRILAYTVATDVVMDGPDFYNDQNNPYPSSFIEIDGGSPTVTITQMRSVNLDGTSNVPANIVMNGNPLVTLLGDAPLRAAKQQYIVASGNPRIWVMGGSDANNDIISLTPLMYSQFNGGDNQSPVVQIGGSGYVPTIGFNLWTGVGSSFYGMQIQEGGPNELDFCTNGAGALGAGNYLCNAGVVNGVFKSTVPDGTAPLTVASHTPPDNLNAWPATFIPSGAQIQNPHITTGEVIIPAGGQVTVLFQKSAQFTQLPTCTLGYKASSPVTPEVTSESGPRAGAGPPILPPLPPIERISPALTQLTSNPSPTGITIFGQRYNGVYFICVGN